MILPAFVNLLPSYPSFTALSPHLFPYPCIHSLIHIVNAPYPNLLMFPIRLLMPLIPSVYVTFLI
jgi:hypothetical protein